MNKLFNFAQTKGKWHKFSSFNLERGAKLYKNFAQKLLAVSLCMAVVLLGVPLGGHSVRVAAADTDLSVSASVSGDKATIVCTLTSNGNSFAGLEVSVTVTGPAGFDSVTETAYTDGEGIAAFYPPLGPAGLYRVVATFAGDSALAGSTATADFTVVSVAGVSLAPTSRSLEVGESFNLTATISPEDAANKNVTWTSSDETVASVSGAGLTGTVKALKAGKTTITVTTSAGAKTATCAVTVKETPSLSVSAVPAGSSVIFTVTLPDGATGSLEGAVCAETFSVALENRSYSIVVTDLPDGTYDYTISYSGDDKYAAASHSGSVTLPGSSLEPFFSTPPAALSGLTFNDTSQTLISAGSLNADFSGCDVEYAVEEVLKDPATPSWSDSLPEGTGAGTYKVLYRVVHSTSGTVLGVSAAPILVTIAPLSLADADIELKYNSHAYTGEALEPDVTVTLVGFDTLTNGSDYVVSYSNNTDAGTATVTITGRGDFTGTVSKNFTITKATPDSSGLTTSLDAFCGQTLGELLGQLAKPKGANGKALDGSWSWVDAEGKLLGDDTKVGSVGEHTYNAVFTATNSNYSTATVDVTVKVSVHTSKWGEAQERPADKKTQFVDLAGKTSIEVKKDNLSQGDVLWLFEESYGTSAWYGLDLSACAFALDNGLRFYVQWVSPNDADYNTYYSQLDDAQKTRVEGDNGWIFLIGIEDPDGNKVQPAQQVSVYVQIGKDWDLEHLEAYYISSGGDKRIPVGYVIRSYPGPGRSGIFGEMILSHFSPYFIFDELADEEKAALGQESSSLKNNVTTGDLATQIMVAGLGMPLVLALGIMLRLITSKRKFDE